jgi:peptidoglycan/LPS O-acetylase OafA/YrhL
VWPFLILLLSRTVALRVCVVLSACALALRIWFSVVAPEQLYASVLTPCRLDALCIGGWFAIAARGKRPVSPERAWYWCCLFAAGVFGVSLWHLLTQWGDPVVLPLRTTLLAITFGLFIYAAARHPRLPLIRRNLRARWLRGLGKYSYGLYVYHGIVSYALFRNPPEHFLTGMVGSHSVAAGLQIVFGVALSLVLAIASYELFEVRFLAMKKYFSYRSDPASVAARTRRFAMTEAALKPQ